MHEGGDMVERRKAKRLPVSLALEISGLYNQDNSLVENLNAPIEVVNISKLGIGFISESILPIAYYFNSSIKLNEDDTFHCVLKIIRKQPVDEADVFMYGCEFVGMPVVLSYIFEEYERRMEAE